jgi:hypothetical protein
VSVDFPLFFFSGHLVLLLLLVADDERLFVCEVDESRF